MICLAFASSKMLLIQSCVVSQAMVRHSVDRDISVRRAAEIPKAKLVEIAEHDDHISIQAGKGNNISIRAIMGKDTVDSIDISVRASKGNEHSGGQGRATTQKADSVNKSEHDDDISIQGQEAGDKKPATPHLGVKKAGHETDKSCDSRRPVDRSRAPSRRPADFCPISERWRDAKGRFCRAPSPAARR